MGLLLLCLFPMVKTHVGIAKEERKYILSFRREQDIRKALCMLKTDLHEHAYSWDELMKGVENERYILKKLKQSTKKSLESGMVMRATLFVGNEKVERTVYVEKAVDHPH